jgi:hypothetical protein
MNNNRQPAAPEVEIDRSMPKIIALAAAGIIFAFFFGYFLKLFIFESGLNYLIFSFSAFILYLTVSLLNVFFIKSGSRTSSIIFLESLAFLGAFYDKLSLTLTFGALASFLILLWANYSGRTELENMLKIRFWRIGKKTLPKAITALALFVGVAYANVGSFGGNDFFISARTFEKIISPIGEMKIVQNFLPGLALEKPFGELVKDLASNQIEQNPQFKLLPAQAKKELVNQTAKELEKKASDLIGTSTNPKTKTSDLLYQAIVNKFKELPENIKSFLPVGLAILAFLTIVSLILPIRWLVSVLAYLVYEICLALRFSTIMLEGRSREIIILK